MVRFSERRQTIKQIEEAIRFLAIQISCNRSSTERKRRNLKTINQLMVLLGFVKEERYLNQRRVLHKHLGALQLLPFLEDDHFMQEVRVCQEAFACLLSEIERT